MDSTIFKGEFLTNFFTSFEVATDLGEFDLLIIYVGLLGEWRLRFAISSFVKGWRGLGRRLLSNFLISLSVLACL